MTDLSIQAVDPALSAIRSTLEADGYEMISRELDDNRLRVDIVATADACEDCLVPKPLMTQLIASALELEPDRLDLRYPGES